MSTNPEQQRMIDHDERQANWRNWGPYLSERSWGTVREDYSSNGEAWDYFPHEHARSRAYRWNEDGIAGICDRYQYLCLAFGFWNEADEILKERLFGLNPREGNHGEDVKECYFYLDSTPTHSYMKMLYKYPHRAFPYRQLIEENQKRNASQKEYELFDTAIFNGNRYFDLFIEYAKHDCNDILIKVTAINKGPEAAALHLLPTLWFRNTWSWGYETGPMNDTMVRPLLRLISTNQHPHVETLHPAQSPFYLYAEGTPEWLFTENETNFQKLYGEINSGSYVKDAFHRYIINNESAAVNPDQEGTKCAAHYQQIIPSQQSWTIRLRLSDQSMTDPFKNFEETIAQRKSEADLFYESNQNSQLNLDEKLIQRQAYAGLLWSKQIYYYDMEQWVKGDPILPVHRSSARNKDWIHLTNFDVISMPDKWEYPWYASWDLCFHCLALVLIDPVFAKRQLLLMTREWYMHPNGQLPAYEWNFSDVNPPVLAWAAWRVYKIDSKQTGKSDFKFLESIFHKLLLNFTWWVNQKDKEGHNVFQGGFLGLDNISVFDRSHPMIEGYIDQADGTAWMGFYCTLMMKISIELARTDPAYQDCATKFFEHFLRIASAMILPGEKGYSLWCPEDGFFYDSLHLNHQVIPLRIRSIVGLLPLFAVETIELRILEAMPVFKRRMNWFLSQRPNYASMVACMKDTQLGPLHVMSILTKERLISTLRYLCDENEFLSEYGIRSLSKYHQDHPYHLTIGNQKYCIDYQPGESTYRLVAGGNSNWRGPVWIPLNYLIIESLQKFHYYYKDSLKIEYPTGSGRLMNLGEVAADLSNRVMNLFRQGADGTRAIYAKESPLNRDPEWQNLILFHEYFHGETGEGLGASHQTGWTALIAKLLQQSDGR
ncbi:MAG: hypothetical protein ACHQUC_03960 [Chlamydiales bacterium]